MQKRYCFDATKVYTDPNGNDHWDFYINKLARGAWQRLIRKG